MNEAFAGLLGVVVGGLLAGFASWLTVGRQIAEQRRAERIRFDRQFRHGEVESVLETVVALHAETEEALYALGLQEEFEVDPKAAHDAVARRLRALRGSLLPPEARDSVVELVGAIGGVPEPGIGETFSASNLHLIQSESRKIYDVLGAYVREGAP